MLVTASGLVMLPGSFLLGQACPCAQGPSHTAAQLVAAAEPPTNANSHFRDAANGNHSLT